MKWIIDKDLGQDFYFKGDYYLFNGEDVRRIVHTADFYYSIDELGENCLGPYETIGELVNSAKELGKMEKIQPMAVKDETIIFGRV